VSDTATNGLWERIRGSDHPIGCLVARNFRMELVGLANYALHTHTWSLQPVYYLEDLYVAPEARGHGARRFPRRAQPRARSWRRIYCHTHGNNHAARALYDQLAPSTDYVRNDIDLSPVPLQTLTDDGEGAFA
jgi:GNAT superfamily N-acetyltransferase